MCNMAFDRQTAPLEIARTVLKPETIREVRSDGYTNSAYLILDRWAMNSPDMLKALESRGPLFLPIRLEQQESLESRTLNSDTAWEMSRRGMSDWEILEQLGIDTELRTIE
jgi:hypothetical protein